MQAGLRVMEAWLETKAGSYPILALEKRSRKSNWLQVSLICRECRSVAATLIIRTQPGPVVAIYNLNNRLIDCTESKQKWLFYLHSPHFSIASPTRVTSLAFPSLPGSHSGLKVIKGWECKHYPSMNPLSEVQRADPLGPPRQTLAEIKAGEAALGIT